VAEPTTFDSATELKASIPSTQTTAGAELPVVVVNGTVSSSNTPALNLEVDNPSPVISSLNPAAVTAGAGDTIVTITGTGFLSSSAVQVNGSTRPAIFVSTTQLTATLAAADLAAAGDAAIVVVNPSPGGGPSAPVSLAINTPPVNEPVPTLTYLQPMGAPIGSPVEVTLNGSGFTAESVVQWNGASLATSYTSATVLTAVVPASLLNLPGNSLVTVINPGPAGGTTASLPFTGFIGIPTNAMTSNPANGLLYVSVPSSAGAPYGNSVVPIDPATGAVGKPIYVGSEPDKLAISSDGQTLWVGLDAASAIQQVNLATATLGMQIPLKDDTGVYAYPPVVHSIAVLPGTSNSIAASVTTNNGLYLDYLAIYDSGVARANTGSIQVLGTVPAIFVNPNVPEIYVTSQIAGYAVFSYNASGVTLIAGNVTSVGPGSVYGQELQIDNGRAYLDSGQVLDAEKTTLLGTFYTAANTPAAGPMFSESSTGRYFALVSVPPNQNAPADGYQIRAFDESSFNPIANSTIPVGGVGAGYKYGAGDSSETTSNGYNTNDTLVRWGSNGIAFRAPNGVFSFRSNAIEDLSTVDADLGLSLAAAGTATTGVNTSVTASITNNGPALSTGVVFSVALSGQATIVSASPSQGSCTQSAPVTCNLGSLANGAKATVTIAVQPMAPETLVLNAQINGSETDPAPPNNTAGASIAVSGAALNPTPALTAISPNAVQAGSAELSLTITGNGFTSDSTVTWSGTPLTTAYTSPSQLTAQVPASLLTGLGWAAVSVTTPSPGGGSTISLPFSIYSVVSLSANHILFDPYSRLLYATIAPGSSQPTGNSLVTVDPATGKVGSPIPLGSQPDKMALSDDCQVLYINEDGSGSVGRFNMLTGALDFSVAVGPGSADFELLRDLAVMPGNENTIAVDLGLSLGQQLYDIDPVQKTATARGSSTGTYTGSSLQFLNQSTLLSFDVDTTGATFNEYPVTSTGLSHPYTDQFTLNSFSSFKLRNGIAFANAGGVADPSATPPQSLGVFLPLTPITSAFSYYQTGEQIVEAEPALNRVFFAAYPFPLVPPSPAPPFGLVAYDEATYLPSATVPLSALNATATDTNGSSEPVSYIDLVRWGQDGLALLTSAGQIAILRGPFVVPQLLAQNPAATLSAATPASVTHGSGNLLLTLTGTGFVPGAATNWNGNYRTTTFVDSGHLTVAIPASDLATAGYGTITVANPGAAISAPLTFTIN
jgi:trimeric autotransporter adhesin